MSVCLPPVPAVVLLLTDKELRKDLSAASSEDIHTFGLGTSQSVPHQAHTRAKATWAALRLGAAHGIHTGRIACRQTGEQSGPCGRVQAYRPIQDVNVDKTMQGYGMPSFASFNMTFAVSSRTSAVTGGSAWVGLGSLNREDPPPAPHCRDVQCTRH